MTHCVVSAGETRLFAGIGLGAVNARMFAMVVLVEEFRFTSQSLSLSAGGFGQLTAVAPPRNVQLGVRLTF